MAQSLFSRKPLEQLMAEAEGEGEHRLKRVLGPVALSALGVGAIIGTGIFVLTGITAHNKTGPSLVVSFIVAGLTCIFSALCYAEFASMVPVAGSAYTYAYATLGQLFAWIIGWDLVLEYAVGAATVAHGWSHYFQSFLTLLHVQWPAALGNSPVQISTATGHLVMGTALIDLPALIITGVITFILVVGIQESARFNAVVVMIKLMVVLVVIGVGIFYINPANWHPFAPFGWSGIAFFGHSVAGQVDVAGQPIGMLSGAAVIFFSYIGFDAVSTQAEEARNPRRDLPIAIISSLVLCTVLYIAMSAVLTGMVRYDQINVDAPVSIAFKQVGVKWAEWLVSLGALAGMTSVLLVMMLSQSRILLAMSRDGLLPKSFFASVHPRFKTPWKSTIVTGLFVGTLASLLPIDVLSELVSIGTLLAFVIVCAAVLIMRRTQPGANRPFRVPLVPLLPFIGIGFCLLLMFSLPLGTWLRLIGWLLVGFCVYFGYSRRRGVAV